MYSMCVKIALCLALVACIDGHVLRTVPLSPEGMTVEIVLKNKNDRHHPVSTMTIDINEKDKKVEILMAEAPTGVPKGFRNLFSDVPRLESRNGIRVGSCPEGMESQGGFCFPSDDA
uniref:Uncharacterized protein n=1 Tax=Heliothis virescens TaxID=7102 RepID=A0A2A4JXU3_HELVI